MLKILFLTLTIFFTGIIKSTSQNIESWILTNERIPVEKIYLHTDREFYSTGETIWLKSYLTDSRSGRLIPGAVNIQVQLINEEGNLALETNLLSVNGLSPGHISIPDTLNQGNYLLRASTDYLLNFGEESFFHKNIAITSPAKTLRGLESRQRTTQTKKMVADVQFLPEGGKLLQGVSNIVAFKATDANGYGVDVKGVVRDETGADVAAISSDYKGMGIFFLNPEPNKLYRAFINGFPAFRFDFDSLIVNEGIKIQLVNQTSRELTVNIITNSNKFIGKPFYLINMHRGNVVFYQAFQIQEQNHLLRFNTDILEGGINQLILLNNNLLPVSERLLFSNNIRLKNMVIEPDKQSYESRSEVNVTITDNDDNIEVSNLSVAVVHEAAFPENGVSYNILSGLLIDSELNGFIESPADYFSDAEISAQAKQRLLMLTNGWSSYFWNLVPTADNNLVYKQTAGLEIHGTATDIKSGKLLKSGEISLIIEKDGEMAFLTQNIEKQGTFSFTGLLFNDSANIYIQAKKPGRSQRTSVELNSFKGLPVSDVHKNRLKGSMVMPFELEKIRYNQLTETERPTRVKLSRQSSAGMEAENESFKDGHFRIYDKADQVVEVPENEPSSGTILDFLEGKVAGLDISGNQVILRGTSNMEGGSSPLFLIDGVPVKSGVTSNHNEDKGNNLLFNTSEEINSTLEKIRTIPLSDIEKVEILKSPQNLAMFGIEGSNGIIAIYTRKGRSEIPSRMAKGMLAQKITGYSSYRKFYTPKYLPENDLAGVPDFRTTLFWEPQALHTSNNTSLSFFTSDQTGKYKIVIEGISESGKICIGTAEFEVLEPED